MADSHKTVSTLNLFLVWIVLVILLGILFFFIPTSVSMAFRYNYSFISILLAVLCITSAYCPERLGNVIFLNIIILACLLPLPGFWKSGYSDPNMVAGLVPFSDASAFYGDAVRILNGDSGRFGFFAARRPLFPGMLASVLELTGRDLRISLALIVVLTGICIYFSVREVQQDYGYVAGFFLFLLLFFFIEGLSARPCRKTWDWHWAAWVS